VVVRARFLLLPSGSWTTSTSADPRLLSDGTILLDPLEVNPARRIRVLVNGTWTALREADLERLADAGSAPLV
jgi:hypothetical protein